jgi:hypothetical protein
MSSFCMRSSSGTLAGMGGAVAAARVHGAVAVAVGVVSLAQDVRFGGVVVVRLRRAVALLQPVSSHGPIVVGVVVGEDQGVGEGVV